MYSKFCFKNNGADDKKILVKAVDSLPQLDKHLASPLAPCCQFA
jgi:hypothetical protein